MLIYHMQIWFSNRIICFGRAVIYSGYLISQTANTCVVNKMELYLKAESTMS